MEPLIQMNKFEVVDMPGMSTIAFLVEKNEEEYKRGNALLSLQKIECIDTNENGRIRKEFNLIRPNNDEKQLIVLLTLTNSKAILSTGELNSEGFRAIETNVPLSYGSLYNQEGVEYKEVEYTPNMKRPISIIDPETGDEVKPILYYDSKTNEVKGKCKLKPYKSYFAFEVRDSKQE